MRKVQSLAAQSNLLIKTFTPGAAVKKEFYQEWPINVEVEGTYHNLGLFFDRVGRLSRLVNVRQPQDQGRAQPDRRPTPSTPSCVGHHLRLRGRAASRPPGAAPRGRGCGNEDASHFVSASPLAAALLAVRGPGPALRRPRRHPVAAPASPTRSSRSSTRSCSPLRAATPTTPRAGATRS